jgi:amino acid adenylation domain-containing protein
MRTAYRSDARIHELFEAQVARSPDARALEWEGNALSYVELNRRANRLAHALRGAGIRRGSAVGICLDRTGELVVAMLAILKAGGAYVPLDATYPLERLQLMIDDLAISLVITQASLRARLPPSVRTFRVDERLADDGYDDSDLVTTGSTDDLAYVMYTSGSTGRPKGVCVPHRGISRLVLETNYIDFGPTDRVAQASNAAFDAATFEIWGALLNGGAIVVIAKELALSPDALAAHLESARISTMFLTTALFNQVAAIRPTAFRSVRHLLFGGEAVDPRAVVKVLEAGGPARLLHVYGPTETTTFATWFEVRDVNAGATVPIGRPIAKTSVHLLDESLSPVPVGEAGELFIGGEGVALGYWKRPDLTAEKFVPDPFGDVPGGRLYRTGDLGRCRADGAIEFLGRIDSQVKIRGFRIEPGEIQLAIEEHPAVRSALVVVRTSEDGDKRLIGYVQARSERRDVTPLVREHLKNKLPDYMVPSALVMVEAWPLNANGKIDQKALPEPATGGGRAYVAPRDPVEERLAEIWASVLGTARVGVDDNFFELGGHSLLAMQLVARIHEQLGVRLSVRAIFESRTVRALADVIAKTAKTERLAPIPRVARAGELPVTSQETRLWFLHRLDPKAPTYNECAAIRIRGPIDHAALVRAFTRLEERHEVLRTRYVATDVGPFRVIDAPPVAPTVVQVQAPNDRAAEQRLREITRKPFDLEAGRAWRPVVVDLPGADHVVAIAIHHILTDEWSLQVLFRDLERLYVSEVSGVSVDLPERPFEYADWAAWGAANAVEERVDEDVAHFVRRLVGIEPLDLPTDRARPAQQNFEGSKVRFTLAHAIRERTNALANGEGTTLAVALLTSFAALVHRYTRAARFAIAMPLAGRDRSELADIAGFFVNTVAIEFDFSDAPSFSDLLRRTKEAVLDAHSRGAAPFDRVVDAAMATRDPSRPALCQLIFAPQPPEAAISTFAGMPARRLAVDSGVAKFDLALYTMDHGDRVELELEYATSLFDAATIERMAGHLQVLLRSVIAEPQRSVHRLALLPDAERRELLHGWNDTAVEVARAVTVGALFEAQVERTPDAVAVHGAAGEKLTYRELNARANQLARHLRTLGVGPEILVGILLERSVESVISVVAVVKAGGAYVPIDPAYPVERVLYTLEDARARVLLTSSKWSRMLGALATHVVCIDSGWAAIAPELSTNLGSVAGPSHLAYAIYTSGSTGKPKGVLIEHEKLLNLVAWHQCAFDVKAGEGTTLLAGPAFDASVFELWPAITAGATVNVVDNETARSPERLRAYLIAREVAISFAPTPLAEILLSMEWPRGGRLRTLHTGGDKLHNHPPASLPFSLVNNYGPTESTVVTTAGRIHPNADPSSTPGIGKPLPNVQTYVLDREMEPMPIGVPGELHVGGAQLARGYLGRPDLTSETFIPNPFSKERGARLYLTGDLARWLPDGTIEFLGRIDRQVKIRGFRIELGEIEAALCAVAGVRDAVVLAREEGEKRLVAYVVAGGTTIDDLRAQLKARLPEYMMPSAFVMLDALPLTPNGKVDRKALPAPEAGSTERAYVAPRTPLEEILATIWCAVLRLARVGVDDNFFELGGHSLLATQVVSRVRTLVGVELPVRVLFDSPTVARLAKEVELRKSGPQTDERPLARVARTGALPLSFAEARLWFLDQYEPGKATYNIPDAVRLRGPLDEHALEIALSSLVARHESLRTRFVTEAGAPLRVIDPAKTFALVRVDAATERAVTDLVTEEALRPFDLAKGPLFRATLVRESPENYVLVLVMHHVVSDGWSMGVLTRELSSLYESERASLPSALPALAIQYADFAVWERGQSEQLQLQISYWKGRLAELPTLDMPTDRPRPPGLSTAGASYTFELNAEVTESLRSLSRREGTTLFMTLLAAFNVLLSRYSGQNDIVIGTPIAHRTRLELEAVVGFFVNTLVIRTDLGGNPTFLELLARVRDEAFAAYAHQDVPFERLVEELQPTRDMSRSPLFQVMFGLQNATVDSLALGGLDVEPFPLALDSSKFDLSLALREHGDGMRGEFEYATSLFDAATIARMAGHLQVLLRSLVVEPQRPVHQLAVLTDTERRELLYAWNDTDVEVAHAATVDDLFEAQVERTPEAPALAWVGGTMTYRELNARANHLARRLQEGGIGPESLVGVCLERNAGLVVALLAVLKSGGGYVPLDPTYPRERLAFILEDAKVALTLTDASSEHALPESGAPRWRTDGVEEAKTSDEPNVRGGASTDNLAYLIYTSGSTGVPKGVAIAHRSVVALLGWAHDIFGRPALAKVAACTSVCFDLSVFELFAPLTCGGQTVLARDAMAVPELAQANELTLINTVPSAMKELLRLGLPTSVRTVNLAGEPLAAELADALYATSSVERVFDLYGPSEDTTYSTFALRTMGGQATIGRPISNSRLYLLDAGMEPVPVGVVGEIYLGGRGLARGYFDRASLTAERFGPDPFGASGGRLYRTGDLARYLPDGCVQFLGRRDHQVKLRGFRIELGEIEVAVRREAGVEECVVVAREGAGGLSLVAYVVPASLDPQQLRAHLKSKLPEYMIPSAFVMLDALPLTANGKLDRKALPAPDAGRSERAYVAPRTPVEEILATTWCSVLRVERVGTDDNFFELGGHSLLAMQVVSRVRKSLGVELPVRVLFESPTVAQLAKEVEQRRSGPQMEEGPLARVARTGALPLSFAEARLWFLDQYEPGMATYNIPDAVRLHGPLDEHALEIALSSLVARHESLRTRFVAEDGAPLRVIDPAETFALVRVDAESEGVVTELVSREALRPFDLAKGPLFRATLIRLSPEEHVLVLVMHHVVSDGWSMGVLMRELSSLYASHHEGSASTLPELPIGYADFAVWERLQSAGLEKQLSYWKTRLEELPILNLPTDRPRPAVLSSAGALHAFELDAETTSKLRSLARREGSTLHMTLLAAFNVLLSRYSGQSDIAIGTPIAHRTRVELEGVVGFFVNTLVLRTDLSGRPTVRELLARVRNETLSAYAHPDVPFERLVEELHPTRDLSRSPLFQVMFSLKHADGEVLALPGLDVVPFPLKLDSSKFDLSLDVAETATGLYAELEYATELFDASTMERMALHLRLLLVGMTRDASQSVSRLSIVEPRERHQLLAEWNGRDVAVAALTAHAMFEAHAEKAPDAVAVLMGARSWSYGEINAWANQLAHRLTRRGVRAGGAVGLQMERSMEAIVGILGILKAGAAYVPLDPKLPVKRREHMVARSGARIVVTAGASSGLSAEEVFLDAALESEKKSNPGISLSMEEGMVVLYTSGSTGEPKGVLLSHRGIVNYVSSLVASWEVTARDRVMQFASLGFDASTEEIVAAWASGAALVIRDEEMLDAKVLLDACEEHQVAILILPTAYYVTLLELVESGAGRWPPSVRVVEIGGERAHAAWIERFYRSKAHPPRLVNAYGPTEASIAVTWCETGEYLDDGHLRFESPLGRVVPNSRVYILDQELALVPAGVIGEICIGGAALATGYVGEPALTAQAFVPNPFASGERLYRTGDQGRFRGDGSLEFVGRVDGQVKIRGFRIEPAEIETVLAKHPDVFETLVFARESPQGEKLLVAYIRARAPIERELRALLAEHVPSYMIPSTFVFVKEWPLTSTGKVDRKALPAPELAASTMAYVAPRTRVEKELAAIWSELLRVDLVGLDDNFFELGGHSLIVTRVVAQVRSFFGIKLPVRALFESPTVRQLAEEVEHRLAAPRKVDAPLVRADRTGLIPLSFEQETFWRWEHAHPGTTEWNAPAALKLCGPLDAGNLTRAVAELVRRHEPLRTIFPVIDGSPRQQILERGAPLRIVDLGGLGVEGRAEELERITERECAHVFDVTREPLFRTCLVRLSDDEQLLFIVGHHLAVSGRAWDVIHSELGPIYAALSRGLPSPFPEPTVHYADYAVAQRKRFAAGELSHRLRYWEKKLEGAAATVLPEKAPTPRPTYSPPCSFHPIAFSRGLVEAAEVLARSEQALLVMVLLTAYKALLHRRTGQEDIVVAAVRSGASETAMGDPSDFTVLRTDLSGGPSFRQLLSRIRTNFIEAWEHELPLQLVLGGGNPFEHALYDVIINFQRDQEAAVVTPFGEVSADPVGLAWARPVRRAELVLVASVTADGLEGGFLMSDEVFTADTAATLIAEFVALLERAVRYPDQPIDAS